MNQRRSFDFVSDSLSSGRRFRALAVAVAVADDFTREGLGLVVDTSLSGLRVERELDQMAALRGCRPAMVVSDNGTELTPHAIQHGQQEQHANGFIAIELGLGDPRQVAGPALDNECAPWTRVRRPRKHETPRNILFWGVFVLVVAGTRNCLDLLLRG